MVKQKMALCFLSCLGFVLSLLLLSCGEQQDDADGLSKPDLHQERLEPQLQQARELLGVDESNAVFPPEGVFRLAGTEDVIISGNFLRNWEYEYFAASHQEINGGTDLFLLVRDRKKTHELCYFAYYVSLDTAGNLCSFSTGLATILSVGVDEEGGFVIDVAPYLDSDEVLENNGSDVPICDANIDEFLVAQEVLDKKVKQVDGFCVSRVNSVYIREQLGEEVFAKAKEVSAQLGVILGQEKVSSGVHFIYRFKKINTDSFLLTWNEDVLEVFDKREHAMHMVGFKFGEFIKDGIVLFVSELIETESSSEDLRVYTRVPCFRDVDRKMPRVAFLDGYLRYTTSFSYNGRDAEDDILGGVEVDVSEAVEE